MKLPSTVITPTRTPFTWQAGSSLFTLHVLWPFLWIWATIYRPDRGWGFSQRLQHDETEISALKEELAALQARMTTLEQTDK